METSVDIHHKDRKHIFFVEWRVTCPLFIQEMEILQQELLKVEPQLQVLQSCASNNIHVSMNELTLHTEEQVQKALEVIDEFEKTDFPSLASGVTMKLGGFGHFNKKVLYVKVVGEGSIHNDPLSEMFNALQKRFSEANLTPPNAKQRAFQAHITVCKAPPVKGKAKSVIPKAVFDKVKEVQAQCKGEQYLTELVFCVKRLRDEDTPPVVRTIVLR